MKKSRVLLKITAFFLFSVILISTWAVISSAEAKTDGFSFPSVSGAKCIYLYNYESDSVVYSNGCSEREKIAPASTVKIMTGLLSLEMLEGRFDEQVVLSEDLLADIEGYTVKFEKDTVVTVRDLLYGLICGGGNDAAVILARICSGSVADFVEKMNSRAREWGCIDTVYSNPTGIDAPSMTTSLHDTVIISKKAAENSEFITMCSAQSYKFTPINSATVKTIANRNAMISSYSAVGYKNSKVKGLNAGMTDRGGYCVSAYATDGNSSYLCVVMGAVDLSNGTVLSYKIANTLLNHAFENYSYELIAKKGDKIGKLGVDFALPKGGQEEMTVDCILTEDIYAYAPKGVDYSKAFTYKTFFYEERLTAPIYAGTEVGGVDIYYGDTLIASGRLVTNEDVQESELLISLHNMKAFLTSRIVIIFLMLIAIFSSIIIFIKVKNKRTKGR